MAYMLPLRFVKVNNPNGEINSEVAVCATRIVAIMSTKSHYARKTVKAERDAGTLINAAGRDAVKSAIWLDNGTVVASPLSVQRILTAIEKSNEKAAGKFSKQGLRLRVYEVADEEPNPEIDTEVDEVAVEDEDMFIEEETSEEETVFGETESDESEDFVP